MAEEPLFEDDARRQARARRRQLIMSMTREERIDMKKRENAEQLEELHDWARGRDLANEVLSHPDPRKMPEIQMIQGVLFDHPAPDDLDDAVRHYTHNTVDGDLSSAAAVPDGLFPMPALIDAWKFVYCDQCNMRGSSVNEAYEARLREEELQTPQERARERIRSEVDKAARRNAKWVIPALERLSLSPEELSHMEKEDGSVFMAIWKQVSPPPPAWVQHIADTQKPWGFVFYKAAAVEAKYGRKWEHIWNELIRNRTYTMMVHAEGRDTTLASLRAIHCRGHMSTLMRLRTETWATVPSIDVASDDSALRRHFQEYRETLESPNILRNTFLVIDNKPITRDILSDNYGCNDEIFWVWAYDAEWQPSEDDVGPNGEIYQGRMKVLISSLDAWFYAARWEDVSLRDMWLRSLRCTEQVCSLSEPWLSGSRVNF